MASLLQIISSRRMLSVLLMGFASGLPLGLSGSTLQAWMQDEKVDLTLIGIFTLVGLPYTLKFLWSPLMDRYIPPILGRRRGWILVMQAAVALSLAALAMFSPSQASVAVAALAFLVAFFSASQDVVIDAYRVEILVPEEYGLGSSYYILGYRIAMLASGGLALILADHIPWRAIYLIMAATMGAMCAVTWWSPEPTKEATPPKSLQEAVVLPFKEFFSRPGFLEVLVFIVIYKLDVVVATALLTPFLMSLEFTKTEIGIIYKGYGFFATILGGIVGGMIMTKISLRKALVSFGLFQGVSGLVFILLAHFGKNYGLLVAAISLENFCSAMGTAAYSAFLMSLCNARFTATQYALLTSLMALTRVFAGAPTGYLAKTVGWEQYYIISMLCMIPGLLMLIRYNYWTIPNRTAD